MVEKAADYSDGSVRLPHAGVGEMPQNKKMASTSKKHLPVDAISVTGLYETLLFSMVVVKVEQVHQISDRRTVQRHVGIVLAGFGIGVIVSATTRQRSQSPVGLDELQDR